MLLADKCQVLCVSFGPPRHEIYYVYVCHGDPSELVYVTVLCVSGVYNRSNFRPPRNVYGMNDNN